MRIVASPDASTEGEAHLLQCLKGSTVTIISRLGGLDVTLEILDADADNGPVDVSGRVWDDNTQSVEVYTVRLPDDAIVEYA